MKLHHICIQTKDYEKSLDFYKNILDFELVNDNQGFQGREHNSWLRMGNIMIELQTAEPNSEFNAYDKKASGPVHIAFMVDDLRAEYDKIKRKGYTNFKVKNGEEVYMVVKNYIFKVIAPEGTEIEIRDKEEL